MKLFHICIILITILYEIQSLNRNSNSEIFDTEKLLTRRKRWLVWKHPGLNWVSLIFGIGIPVNIQQASITLGMVMKAFYLLPTNSSYYTRPYTIATLNNNRKKRSPTRWKFYEILEDYLDRNDYPDGKACLLKSICEAAAVPLEERSGLIAEIFHTVLTPSSTDDVIENSAHRQYHVAEKLGKTVRNCSVVFPECPLDPVQQFSKFLTLNKFMH